MKPTIYHYPRIGQNYRRNRYRHAAVIIALWASSAAIMATIINQLLELIP